MYTEYKYIEKIGATLRNFHRTSQDTWNVSCPICGDSARIKSKARGYFFRRGVDFFYTCHNDICAGRVWSLQRFIKEVSPSDYSSYIREKYQDRRRVRLDLTTTTNSATHHHSKKVATQLKLERLGIPKISQLEDDHPAKVYLVDRGIATEHLIRFGWADNFGRWVKKRFPKSGYEIGGGGRIIIPCYDRGGKLLGAQGRSIDPENRLRYITVKADKESPHLYYGLERWDPEQLTYVTEGPIDSLFLPNALAVIGADLYGAISQLIHFFCCDKNNFVLVFDNEPRSWGICKLLSRAIREDFRVVVWPSHHNEKDINEMILVGRSREQIVSTVNENTFRGLSAKLAFAKWKRI